MSLAVHLQQLKKKHSNLSDQIEDLEKDTAFDQQTVAELKRKRLQIKDRITQIESSDSQPTAVAAE